MSEYWRGRGHPPCHPESRFWTADEIALLGTGTDEEVAGRLGRSVNAVRSRRHKSKIPANIVMVDGRRLRRLRKKSGITQTTLAQRAGISRCRVGTLERRSWDNLRRERAERLAAALGCDVAKLVRAK
jgi:DNA-binding XRE family transcriptional regulator